MRYGFFDESKKEYVITRPDTPAPWVNYLGSPEYGAIISNNAGGYSFAKSGANGRILRYIFNQFDQPGRYIYLRDQESEDYWSASWQPVGKDLNSYKSECHHGTAYTKMMADYSEIHSEVRYYVPLNQSYEVWNLAVTNTSDRMRKINVTGYLQNIEVAEPVSLLWFEPTVDTITGQHRSSDNKMVFYIRKRITGQNARSFQMNKFIFGTVFNDCFHVAGAYSIIERIFYSG